jgi:hypothetical protein
MTDTLTKAVWGMVRPRRIRRTLRVRQCVYRQGTTQSDGELVADSKAIAVIEDQTNKTIRRTTIDGVWWFIVVEVVGILFESAQPRFYWGKLTERLENAEGASEVLTKCRQSKMPSPDGKLRATDAATTETLLRIIQSIPSPKAEPVKRWLATTGTNGSKRKRSQGRQKRD